MPKIGLVSIVFNSRRILPRREALELIISEKIVSRLIKVTKVDTRIFVPLQKKSRKKGETFYFYFGKF